MKRHFIILLLSCVASISASAYDFCVNGIYYDKNGSEATVTSGNTKYSGLVTIPESVTYSGKTYSVTSIGDVAFWGCSSLTSVTIPNSVTEIGDAAFSGCSSLASVTIGNSVSSIGYMAFSGCSSLTAVTIPNSVTEIGDAAFHRCSALTSVTIPDSVTEIGNGAFIRCRVLKAFYGKFASSDNRCLIVDGTLKSFAPYGLTTYSIPNSVTSIGSMAFSWCSGLTSVTIPNSVTSIGDSAFSWCSGLTSVAIPNSVISIGDSAFSWCSGLTSVAIPNSVTSIGDSAFSWCSGLTSVAIPNSVTEIGDWAFHSCSGLTSVTIPDSVTEIGNGAFIRCSSLTSVTIPDSVTSIGYNAFYGTALYNNDSNWENNVLYICNHLIKANTDLSGAYTIKDGTVTIADEAFIRCSSLTSMTIPNSVTSIGKAAFLGCSSLEAFYGKYVSSDNRCLIVDGTLNSFAPSGINSYNIPSSVTSIGSYAFAGCSSLEAFYGKYASSDNRCLIVDGTLNSFAPSGLTTYKIPDSVTSIGEYAFYECSNLTSVTILGSVTSIGDGAFENCSGLTSVTVDNNNPANILLGYYVFEDVPTNTCILYVPMGSKELYAVADQWKDFENIEEFVSGVEDVIVD